MSNVTQRRFLQTWRPILKLGIRAIYPIFELLYRRCAAFRNWSERPRDPESGLLNRTLFLLQTELWRRRTYDPQRYKEWQRNYWSTIGVSRWIPIDTFDFSDTESLLRRAISPIDRTFLELGCGRGKNLQFVATNFSQLQTFAIDAAEPMCEAARKNSPSSTVVCGFYGPDSPPLPMNQFDVVFARSTVTYIDEIEIKAVLTWIFGRAKRCVVLSEPSGVFDAEIAPSSLKRLGPGVYKRLHDHTHIRDYAAYVSELKLPFDAVEVSLETSKGNRTWIFNRSK